jgi:sigma-B regulation protein RsbU (phosphoserine phosphatase)
MPIKTKFLLITALLLTLSSATIFWINRTSFVQDKKAYLYSSAMETMQASAQEASFGTEKVLERVQTAVLFLDPVQLVFSPQIKEIALQQNWGDLQVYRMVGDENQFLDSLTESNAAQVGQLKYLRSLAEEQLTTDLDINKPDILMVYYRKKDLLIYGALRFDGLKFTNSKGNIGIYSPAKNQWNLPENLQESQSFNIRLAALFNEKNSGVKELEWKTTEYLVSYTYVSQLNSFLFQTFEKGKIFSVLKQSLNKTFIASIIILIVGLIATIFAADSITRNISLLASEMTQFTKKGKSEGISLVANDEVGKMAGIYNSMLAKIQSLLEETAAKARMESELSTAKEVQGYLLPKNKVDTERFILKGFYKPASECSGEIGRAHV